MARAAKIAKMALSRDITNTNTNLQRCERGVVVDAVYNSVRSTSCVQWVYRSSLPTTPKPLWLKTKTREQRDNYITFRAVDERKHMDL